jgi:DNA-binding MarR family transcriptional regulator
MEELQKSIEAHLGRDSEAADFYDALSEFIRIYQFRDRDRIFCHGISVTQCYALEVLVKDGPLTLNELASRLYLDKSTVSRVVATLENKELIQRKTHADDRRAVHLDVTSGGQELYAGIRWDIEKRDQKLLDGFPPVVRRGMIELLRRLTAAAEERVRTTGGSCSTID